MRFSLAPLRYVVALIIFALVAVPATASAPSASDQSVWQATLPPALDGDLTDWSGVPILTLDQDVHSVINGPTPLARSDAMYTLQMLHTADALYLGLHARDDKRVADSGTEIHKDDSFRFSVDGNKDGVFGGPSDHFYRFRFDGAGNDNGNPITALAVYTAAVATGWNLEIRIPASHLALPLGSDSFKFSWGVGDDDDNDGGGLNNFLLWAGTNIEQPDLSWPVASLDGPSFTPVGLLEAGRWEWYGGGPLNAVVAGTGANVWAAGNGVWRTTNNGTNWSRAPLLANDEVRGLQFWDSTRGLAHTTHQVYFTEDGGATWRLSLNVGANKLVKLVAAGTDSAWLTIEVVDAFGDSLYDTVLSSRDGGVTWQTSLTPGDLSVVDSAAYSLDRAWVLYNEGGSCSSRLYRTTDAGVNWTALCISDGGGPIAADFIAFPDPLVGWLAGTQGSAYVQPWRTTDGGATWQKQNLGVEGVKWLTAVDPKHAWLASGAQLYRTIDGSTWNKVSDNAPDIAVFRTSTDGWGLVGRSIRRTTDGGATWSTVYTPSDAPFARWWDHLHGWRVNGAMVERTVDGGGWWDARSTGLRAVDNLQFVDAQNGWAWDTANVGLSHTTDGGASWKVQNTGSDALYSLQFVDHAHGWVTDSGGNLRRTVDGGKSWVLASTLPDPEPVQGPPLTLEREIYFVNYNVGHYGVRRTSATGYCDTFYSRTQDGGQTWGTLQPGPSGLFTFGSGSIGWGISQCPAPGDPSSEQLAKTTSGGASWFQLAHPSFRHIDSYAADAEQLFLYGALAPADKSSDGGISFLRQRAETAQLSPRSRLDRIFREEPAATSPRMWYRNTEVSAYYASVAPRIDGNLDDWTRPRQFSLKAATAQSATGGVPLPMNSSAVLRAAWDSNNLYVAVRVYDDEVHVDTPDKPWQDDGVELGIDPAHDHVAQAPDEDRQYLVTADGNQYLWGSATQHMQVARQTTADGYTLEIRIPRSSVYTLDLSAGALAGFNFSVIDDIDGGNAETRLFWTGSRTSTAQANWGQIRFSPIDAGFVPSDDTPTPSPTPTTTETPTSTPTPTATPTSTPGAGGSIGGKAWLDVNRNGQIDSAERGLAGVTVKLFAGAAQIGQKTTDGQGDYRFDNLSPGVYTAHEVQPSWVRFSTTPDEVSLVVGALPVTVNFGDWKGIPAYLPLLLRQVD